MTDTEISRRLALAIGYRPEDVEVTCDDFVQVRRCGFWDKFDRRDERTIFRIATRYRMFPRWSPAAEQWVVSRPQFFVQHDCPATCIALAVIEASERGLLS